MENKKQYALRILLFLSANQSYYDATAEEQKSVKSALGEAFGNLGERFKVRVLGTLDDDLLMAGPGYRGYVLLDAEDFQTVVDVCGQVKEVEVGPHRLHKYLGLEARIGRQLPFVEV